MPGMHEHGGQIEASIRPYFMIVQLCTYVLYTAFMIFLQTCITFGLPLVVTALWIDLYHKYKWLICSHLAWNHSNDGLASIQSCIRFSTTMQCKLISVWTQLIVSLSYALVVVPSLIPSKVCAKLEHLPDSPLAKCKNKWLCKRLWKHSGGT